MKNRGTRRDTLVAVLGRKGRGEARVCLGCLGGGLVEGKRWRLACSVVEKVQACLLRDYIQEDDKRIKGGYGGGEVGLQSCSLLSSLFF
jgi:hypothetical protein